jgi:hypothetical protein
MTQFRDDLGSPLKRRQDPVIAALRLIGPVAPHESSHTVRDKAALLLNRKRRLRAVSENPYQNNFRLFLRDCVWTTDEARGGRVAPAPDWLFLDDVCDMLITEKKLFIEKSRRVFASWTVCAFDVWLAAGGQDPRWKGKKTDEHPEGEPSLMRGNSHRQIFIVARKFEKPGSDWFLQSRVKFICEQFELHGCHEMWPAFPRFQFKEGEATFSNGSTITAVAQGADQLRGPTSTFVHCEETAFWEMAQPTMEGLLPSLLGGGHVAIVTTAQAATYAQKIRDGKLKPDSLYAAR